MSQEHAIAKYLMQGKALTPQQALRLFGSFRLSARIYDIKARAGENSIKTFMVETGGKRVARYLGDPTLLRRAYS